MKDVSILANDNTYDSHIDVLRGKIDHTVILSEMKENVYYQIRTTLAKPMRNFHNWIKSIIIYTHCNPQYEDERNLSVLDIACGRGGDIMKFYYSRVNFYVGIDIDNNGIISPTDGAISRYNKLRRSHPNFPRMFFIHADGGALLDYENQIRALGTMTDKNKDLINKFFTPNKRTTLERKLFHVVSLIRK
jgi:SAM-dependent methyltransferase